MRTTLNIADDVLLAAKRHARRENRSIGEVLSDLARCGLTRSQADAGTATGSEPSCFYGFAPLAPRGNAVSNALIDRLREQTVD